MYQFIIIFLTLSSLPAQASNDQIPAFQSALQAEIDCEKTYQKNQDTSCAILNFYYKKNYLLSQEDRNVYLNELKSCNDRYSYDLYQNNDDKRKINDENRKLCKQNVVVKIKADSIKHNLKTR